MTNFSIVRLNNEPYNYLIIATNYCSSLSDVNEIMDAMDLNKGKVLFDFMLINGNKKNRFIECEVVDSRCVKSTFKLAGNVDNYIREVCSNFFVENEKLVKNSVLPRALKYLITTGNIM